MSTSRPALAPVQVPIRLGGREVLTLRGVVAHTNDGPVSYLFTASAENRSAQSSPAGGGRIEYELRSTDASAKPMRCRVRGNEDGTQAVITLEGDQALKNVTLLAIAPEKMLPVRIKPVGGHSGMCSILGPAALADADGLYDPADDAAVELSHRASFQPARDGVVVSAILEMPGQSTSATLALQWRPHFLRTIHKLTDEVLASDWKIGPSPAGWTSCRADPPMSPAEIGRNVAWLSPNFQPLGLETIWTGGGDRVLAERIERMGFRIEPCPPVVTENPSAGPAGPDRAWGEIIEAARELTRRYWVQGFLPPTRFEPIRVGEPLSLEQARFQVSLRGLSGRPVVIGDAVHALPAERVALLEKIIPPAPIRAVALVEQPWGDLWHLRVATAWDNWEIIGLFNESAEPTSRPVRLEELGLATGASQRWAVFDVWERRLIAVTEKGFSLPLPVEGCRVVALKRVSRVRPTLLGSGRHITCGAIDLSEVNYDAKAKALSGRSDMLANRAYELYIYLPAGGESFEISGVRVDGAQVVVRQDGPIRIVTLQSTTAGSVPWLVTFQKALQLSEPPTTPVAVKVRQDVHGVRLAWRSGNDQPVRFRIYRDGEPLVETEGLSFLDSSVAYDTGYRYALQAVDWSGRTSLISPAVAHRTPVPRSANLTQLVPISVSQDRFALAQDRSVKGRPMRVAGRRYHRGLGTHANARVRYFLGKGYKVFTGEAGIDDETQGAGSAVFHILGDGEELFTSKTLRGHQGAQPFRVPIGDVRILELKVTDGGDGTDGDHADWGNPYLHVK